MTDITNREFDQLSLRVSELAQRLDTTEADRVANAIIAERVTQIRTDFADHETKHAERDAAIRSDLRSLLFKVGTPVVLALIGEIVQALHNYVLH